MPLAGTTAKRVPIRENQYSWTPTENAGHEISMSGNA
jgi:hypothetical protein